MKTRHPIFQQQKSLIALLISFFLTITLYSQNEPCGLNAVMGIYTQENPDYENQLHAFDQAVLNNPSGGLAQKGGYEIPVAVHVIHENGIENISEMQIIDAIDQANEQLAGAEGGVNTKIQLKLARIDPLGNCTSGVNRVVSSLTNLASIFYWDDVPLKNLSRWNPGQYLNIWIVKDIPGNVTGYAYIPPVSSERDGIVIQHDYFGLSGTAAGRDNNTLVHELGHYLSLHHPWGPAWMAECDVRCGDPNDCENWGDRVCDTGPSQSSVGGGNCDDSFFGCINCPNQHLNQALPKDNYMGYSLPCQDRFTAGQLTRMYVDLNLYRAQLCSKENRICTGLNTTSENLSITEHETWTITNLENNGDIAISGNLTIETGASLTIENGVTVRFCGQGKLIIKPNARLNLSGTLTSSCDTPWKGVEVWGNSSESQYTDGQGRLEARSGSVIENAEIGVQLWGPDYINNAGGEIWCDGTSFHNNQIAVKFAPYENFWPYSFPSGWMGQPRNYFAYFHNCYFYIDNSYSNPSPFHSFLHMTGVNGVKVFGSIFSNQQILNDAEMIDDYGYGIFAVDAGFEVYPRCKTSITPCNLFTGSSFSGLGYGIRTANIIGNKAFTLREANFYNCFVGLYNNAVSHGTILSNNFTLGNVPDPNITSEQLGVVFESGISGFIFEENNFTGLGGNATTTIGTLCKELGYFNNIVRRNNYNNLSFGNLANGQNATNMNIDRGLQYLCNINQNNSEYDFSAPNTPLFDRIRHSQGLEQMNGMGDVYYDASGNEFSYTGIDFFNQGSNPVDYYYFGGGNQIPMNFEGLITLYDAEENPCGQVYRCNSPCNSEEEIALKKERYYKNQTKETLAKTEWENAQVSGDADLAGQKQKERAYYQSQMDQAAFEVSLHLVHDTLSFHPDTLGRWLENLNVFSMDLILAIGQQTRGNTVEVQRLLQKAASREDLSNQQSEDLIQINDLLEVLNNHSPYQLEEEILVQLDEWATNQQGLVANISKNILSLYGYRSSLIYYLPSELVEKTVFFPSLPIAVTESIIVSPNPNEGVFNFSWNPREQDQKNGILQIMDVSGKTIGQYPVTAFAANLIDLGQSHHGIYLYRLQIEGQNSTFGKLLVH